jgi:hypothetical protein
MPHSRGLAEVRRALIVVVACFALAAVALLVAVPILIQRNLSVEAVAARGSDLFGRPVTIERVRLAFRPGLRIRAEGVVIAGGGSADVVDVELAILPLLRRRFEPSELHLQGARFPIERGPDGNLRLRLLHPPGRSGGLGGGAFPALPAFDARDGEFYLLAADGTPASTPPLRILRLEAGRLRNEGRTPVRLELALDPAASGELAVGGLRLEAFLELAEGAVRVRDGWAEGNDLQLRSLRFPRFEGGFDYAPGRIGVERFLLTGYQGTVALEGVLQPGRPGRFEGTLRGSGLDLSGLVEDWRGRPLSVRLGELDLEGQVALFLRAADRGTGHGEIAIREGKLPTKSLFSELLGAIGRLGGRLISLGGQVEPSPSKLERLSARWELRDDRLHTQDLEVVTDDYRYAGAGSLGLDQSLAFSGGLKLTSRGAQRMVASAALPLPGASAVVPEIPLDVGGRLGAPSFTARTAGLPSAAQATLSGLVRGGGGLVQDAAQVGKDAAQAGKGVLDHVLGR